MKDHWSLLTVLQTDLKKIEVKYFDSLSVPDEGNLQLAGFILEQVRKDLQTELKPVNHAKQPVGTAVCGCFALFWLEQKCRQVKGETPCSMGWPSSKTWSERVKKLMKALGDLQISLKADAEKQAEKESKNCSKS